MAEARRQQPLGAPPSALGELLDKAKALVPALRDRSEECIRRRDMMPETLDDFRNAGLFGLLKPRRFGGKEIRYDDFLQVTHELARGDGSAAWVYSVLTAHELLIALWPIEVQEELFDDPQMLCASSFAPSGKAERASGGYRLTGKWSFCSGVNHSDWILLSGTYDGDPADIRYALVPLSECRIVDDWNVVGLCGTGSHSVVADDIFVPDPYIVSLDDLTGGTAPGGDVHERHVYRSPLFATNPFCLAAPAGGIAVGALEQFVAEVRDRDSVLVPVRLAEMRHIRMRVAEASALMDAAQLLFTRSARETLDIIESGEPLSTEHRVRSRRDQTFLVMMATRSVDLLFKSTGGHGLHDSKPVQRAWRDLHALGAHVATTWDLASASYGSVLLGGEPTDILL